MKKDNIIFVGLDTHKYSTMWRILKMGKERRQ